MIVYLKNKEIDRDLWDNCILTSQTTKPYAYSWYLDIMAPGWEALIDDDYDAVFPLPGFSKFGIKYISTPIFLQQLGVFSPDESTEIALNEFLDFMPEFYRLIDLCVAQKARHESFKVIERSNYELDLSKPYDTIWSNFQQNCRRNIEKASKKKIEIADNITPEELINLFFTVKEKVAKGIKPRDYSKLKQLMDYCIKNNKGRILGVRGSRKKVLFGLFLIETAGYVNLFFTANSLESRERRINYFVINEIIKGKASTNTILDFAGSSIPSIATFMESFGSVNVPYYRIYRNKLPWPVRMLK